MERPLTIGQLARATGVPAKTIRSYEQVGVLPVPRRSDAGYRHSSRHDVHRLLVSQPGITERVRQHSGVPNKRT
jgi:MerR-like DNA binding protein